MGEEIFFPLFLFNPLTSYLGYANILVGVMDMSKKIDLVGKRFGQLEVLSEDRCSKGQIYYNCKCGCGEYRVVKGSRLRDGSVYSCSKCTNKRISKARHISLVGKVYGRLTVVAEAGHTKTGEYIYECRCLCGNVVNVNAGNLVQNHTRSCGCLQKEIASVGLKNRQNGSYKDLGGRRFGSLVVKQIENINDKGIPLWKCKCDCGNEIIVRRDYLVGGVVKSCGCLRHEHADNFSDISGKKFGMLTAISPIRQGVRTYWKCRCECGEETLVERSHLISGTTASCGNHSINFTGSKGENEVKDFIESLGVKTEKQHKILDGKEIDIFIPEHNTGIEYNGSNFHASVNAPVGNNKPMGYHRDKFLLAKEKGIHLISIFDVDWENNQEKIKEYLSYLLQSKRSIMARKCELVKLSINLACDFVDRWHLQGANKQAMQLNYGLYNTEGKFKNLVAVMSFGKPRLRRQEGREYELHRYCVMDGCTIVGGAERLLHQFEVEYGPKKIISYSDNDYFLGSIYERLGFENKGQCKPRYYWYLSGKEIKREKCMLKHLRVKYPELLQEAYDFGAFNKEDYVMSKLGACKVYRSGNTRWEKYCG